MSDEMKGSPCGFMRWAASGLSSRLTTGLR